MDYRKTAQEIYDHIGKKRISFPLLTVQQDFVWLLQTMQRQTRIMWRILTE